MKVDSTGGNGGIGRNTAERVQSFLRGWLLFFITEPDVLIGVVKEAPALVGGGAAPDVAFAGCFKRECVDDTSTWGTVVTDRRGERCWCTGVGVNGRKRRGPEKRRVPLRRHVQV